MKTLKVVITGAAPLLLHNGRLSDQLDPIVKQLKSAAKSTNKGTEDGQEEISRLEFIGSLYWNDTLGAYIPGANFERAIRDGSAGVQKGLKKKFSAAVQVLDDAKLVYPGKYATPDALFKAGTFVHRVRAKVQMSAVSRTRPVFQKWSATFSVDYLPEVVDRQTLVAAIEYAGRLEGIGDWRPRYGRFTAEVA